jgi:UDP-glucose 4-epimerase
VLITGAGGYIGGRLVATLRDAGWQVHGLVREPAPRLGIEQTVCDLADPEPGALAAACEGAETVVHLAGENEVIAAEHPAAALAETVVATEKLSEACAEASVRRLVYMSTVHVYGARIAPGVTLTEDMRAEPRSVYAISRLTSEHVAAGLAEGTYELVILRLSNSVGAPDDPSVDRWSLVANDLSRQGATTGQLELRSSGAQWRDFVPLRSVCEALATASRAADSVLPPGTYNLASGKPLMIRALAGMIQDEFERQTGGRPALRAPDPEPNPPEPYYVSVERAAQHGIRLAGSLRDAVADTVRFCLDHREELR